MSIRVTFSRFHVLQALLCGLVLATRVDAAGLPPIPAPTATRYPGTIALDVDLRDTEHKIMAVHESMPVRPGHLVLLYPQWIPGSHSPLGNVAMLTGLHLSAAGQALRWVRDPVNVFAFHVDVPAGATALDIDFQFTSPLLPAQGRVVMTADIVHLQFHSVVLYPAGFKADGITVAPGVRLPAGWKAATALEPVAAGAVPEPDLLHYQPTDLTTLIDSPLMAGRLLKRYALAPAGSAPVMFDAFTEHAAQGEASEKVLAPHRALVVQANKLFGAPPYAHYDFLMALTENIGGIGREHFRSTEIVETPTYFADVLTSSNHSGVVPHEYVHAWIGKFRRPADQLTNNFSQPLQNSLLWVYEGQTSYYGDLLGVRSGLRTQDVARDRLAVSIASAAERRGRAWRDLQDTVNDELISHRSVPRNWPNWQRQLDYYNEGSLLWLGIDARLRQLSGEQRSLDDFAAAFYALGKQPLRTPSGYRFEDVAAALNAVAPHDWAALLHARLDAHDDAALMDDVRLSGWRLVYNKTPNPVVVTAAKENNECDAQHSLGFVVAKMDAIAGVQWDSPAFKAGITPGATLLAVDGRAYKCSELTDAIAAAEGHDTPIELIVRSDNRYRVVRIAYAGGVRYPHLERIEGVPDRLTAIFNAR